MEKFFNFLCTGVFIVAVIFLFYVLSGKQNKKRLIPVFIVLVITFLVDLINTYTPEFKIIYAMLYVFFILAIMFFMGCDFNCKGIDYENKMSFLTKLFFVFYLLIVFKTAWVSDDAYITFRVADNFVNGYGLRWNVEERVQVFTNTLFLFVFIPFYFIFRDAYFVSLFLNFLFSIATILLLKKTVDSKEKFLIIIVGLCFSKAYIDFSTSGLENSLTFFLLALFLYVLIKFKKSDKKSLYLTLIFSCLFLNRPDSVLIILPAILLTLYRDRPPVKIILSGLIPLFAWETFSVIYYGFPLPNTFYAKLNTGIGRLALIKQGVDYFFNSILIDPVTLFTVFSAIIVGSTGLIKKKNEVFPFVSAGIVLYLLYVLYIGGDFMSGRFFACCIPVSLFMASDLMKKQKIIYAFLLTLVFLCLNSPFYSVYNFNVENRMMTRNSVQVISEREFYYRVTGLLNVLTKGKKVIDESGYAKDAKRLKNDASMQKKTAISTAIGMFGFYAGPDVYIIDQVSIADAFTARLPAAKRWRIGHFAREWPEGYEETLRQGTNLIKDGDLSVLYEKICLITKGKIFTKERFKTILEINFKKDFYRKK